MFEPKFMRRTSHYRKENRPESVKKARDYEKQRLSLRLKKKKERLLPMVFQVINICFHKSQPAAILALDFLRFIIVSSQQICSLSWSEPIVCNQTNPGQEKWPFMYLHLSFYHNRKRAKDNHK